MGNSKAEFVNGEVEELAEIDLRRKQHLDRLVSGGHPDHSVNVKTLMNEYVKLARTCRDAELGEGTIGYICRHPRATGPLMCLWIDCPQLVISQTAKSGRLKLVIIPDDLRDFVKWLDDESISGR